MSRATSRGAAFVAVLATALTLLFTGAASAWQTHGNGGCASGTAVGDGATPLNSFAFTVCQRSADIHDVTGYFQAAGTPPLNVIAPRGPVTCADVEGSDASFYYPFGPGSVPPPNPAFTGIIIIAHDGGATGDSVALVPVLAGANADCSQANPVVSGAKLTALPVISGGIEVRARS